MHRTRTSLAGAGAGAEAEAMANELPMTVIDFVDGRARFGYAAE